MDFWSSSQSYNLFIELVRTFFCLFWLTCTCLFGLWVSPCSLWNVHWTINSSTGFSTLHNVYIEINVNVKLIRHARGHSSCVFWLLFLLWKALSTGKSHVWAWNLLSISQWMSLFTNVIFLFLSVCYTFFKGNLTEFKSVILGWLERFLHTKRTTIILSKLKLLGFCWTFYTTSKPGGPLFTTIKRCHNLTIFHSKM